MTVKRSVLWYGLCVLGIFCIVLVSGCTAPGSSSGSLPGLTPALSIGTSTNVGGLNVMIASAKIVDISPFAATYKKETGKDLPPSKNIVAVVRISNPGSTALEVGRAGAFGIYELRDGAGKKYTLSPVTMSTLKYELNPGEQTSFTIYGDVGKDGTDTTLTNLKQHAELVMMRLEGDKITGDIAKWDATPVFN